MPATFLLFGRTRPSRPSRPADGWRPGGVVRTTVIRTTDGRRDLACPTRRALERWVARRLGAVDHERRVAAIATDLFDVTRPLHKLGPADRQLLCWAAVVHDVGRAVCDQTHPADGARMLLDDRSLPLAPADRRHLAYLTLYHRGKVPAAGRDDVLARTDDHDRLLRVLSLLRAADGLDNRSLARRQHAPPRVEFALAGRPGRRPTLHVTCHLGRESRKARRVYGRRKKFRLMAEVLGCDVTPQVVASEAVTPRAAAAALRTVA